MPDRPGGELLKQFAIWSNDVVRFTPGIPPTDEWRCRDA